MSGLLMTCEEAVAKFVHDGDTVAVGGFTTNRKPYALVREIIRQRRRDLYIEGSGAGGEIDMLIGAGCVKVIINAYISNAAFGNVSRRFRMAIERGQIKFEDYTLDTQPLRYHAAALGLPFIAVRRLLVGSDLVAKWGISVEEYEKDPKLPPAKFLIQPNPFNPEEDLVYLPAPKIDVALIHVQKAACDGTIRIEGPIFVDDDLAMAAKYCIVSCEELVDPEELRKEPWLNQIPGFVPAAIVHAPYGAHPSQCAYYYDYDPQFLRQYHAACKDDDQYASWLNEYVYGVPDHQAYLEKVGRDRLEELRVTAKNYVEGLPRGKEVA